ncbi:hypothetical protein BN970_05060 [Mycolicibacterium conceptionense]|uniref:Uncharacterized protein n=1 Tax=Mycolicibacterium conceptionense TaxID=451644 RepID=A0A0U1DTU7_9MYCO|nr:hypothetical protein BN970_05060 [Mycolicibacterium conceptionense]
MYYLIQPNLSLLWRDISEYLIDRLAKEHPEIPIDLGRLTWDPAERPFDVDTLRLALRYGSPVPSGLAITGRDLVPLDHLRQVRELKSIDSTKLPHADFFEQFDPGWRERSRELDARWRPAESTS